MNQLDIAACQRRHHTQPTQRAVSQIKLKDMSSLICRLYQSIKILLVACVLVSYPLQFFVPIEVSLLDI